MYFTPCVMFKYWRLGQNGFYNTSPSLKTIINPFQDIFLIYTLWKHQQTSGLLKLKICIEMEDLDLPIDSSLRKYLTRT